MGKAIGAIYPSLGFSYLGIDTASRNTRLTEPEKAFYNSAENEHCRSANPASKQDA